MNEKEEKAFRLAYAFYEKWRGVIIEADGQWAEFARDAGKLCNDIDIENCQLGWHLVGAVLDTFNDLYRDGKKPVPDNYFGREDI